jgi:hypothetical protein
MMTETQAVEPTTPCFPPSSHTCGFYESEEEHRALITPFLLQGLERGERVVYITDAHSAETIRGYLQDAGVDGDAAVARGQLVFRTAQETYLQGDRFDPDRMLKHGERILGVLDVQATTPDAFDLVALEALSALADQLAVALENARLFGELSRRMQELSALYDNALCLAATGSLDELLGTTIRRATALLHARGGGIYLYDPAADELEWVVGEGIARQNVGVRLRPGEGLPTAVERRFCWWRTTRHCGRRGGRCWNGWATGCWRRRTVGRRWRCTLPNGWTWCSPTW